MNTLLFSWTQSKNMHLHKKIFLVSFLTGAFLLLASHTLAATPAITSFTTSAYSTSYGHPITLTWKIENSGSHAFLFTCPSGVTVKKTDGTVFTCGIPQPASQFSSDWASFLLSNVTGSSKTVMIELIPYDINGVGYKSDSQTISVAVGAVPQPISAFSVSTSTVTSSVPFSFSWTGIEVSGVNIQIECVNGITFYTGEVAVTKALPCGTPAFTTDLNSSGSVEVIAVNELQQKVSMTAWILPAITSGSYDGTHSEPLIFTIGKKTAATVPSIASFTHTTLPGIQEKKMSFSWSASNTAHVMLRLHCPTILEATYTHENATKTLYCNDADRAPILPAQSSTTVSFKNTTGNTVLVTLSALPQNSNGTFDGATAKTISLTIERPSGNTNTTPTNASAQTVEIKTTPAQSTTAAPNASAIKAARTAAFSVYLAKGSRHKEVTALQQFLAQGKTLYPEGSVTGYFGPATDAALKRFQVRYGIASPSDEGYGLVGPKTRAKLNSLEYF